MTVFGRGRQATAVAVALALLAMLQYPGGTPLDPSTSRYQLFQNFLSDLGMTVSYSGQRNGLGASLFIASLTLLVFGLGGCLVGFVRLYRSPRGRLFARAALFAGVVVSISFLGVAFTPENRLFGLHVWFTFFAFRVFPVVPLLFLLATLFEEQRTPRFARGWVALTLGLIAYAIVMNWGPPVGTPGGLTTQVVAQKLVSIFATALIFAQSIEADRLAAQRQVIA